MMMASQSPSDSKVCERANASTRSSPPRRWNHHALAPATVSSPTFTIVQEYRGPQVTLQHVDLYRLTPREITDLALEDLMTPATVMAIEWAERLDVMPRGPVVEVRLEHDGDARRIDVRRT